MILPRGSRRGNTRSRAYRYADAPPDYPLRGEDRVDIKAHLIPWSELSDEVKHSYINGWSRALVFLEGDALSQRVEEIYTKIQRSEQSLVDALNPAPRFFKVLRTEHLRLSRAEIARRCNFSPDDTNLLTHLENWGVSHIKPGESFFGASWFRLHYVHKYLCRGLNLHITLSEFGRPYTPNLHREVTQRVLPDWVYYTFTSDLRYVRGESRSQEEYRAARTKLVVPVGPTLEFFESTF